ncbi:MAG: M3 family oligoendopeptidase, partial [Candidatus Marinimicrobia bacterium]|nr:M3 family oligoendopeptidase [Candidatus Neomarinimicrobiota bacterium]
MSEMTTNDKLIPPDLEISGWNDLAPYFEALKKTELNSVNELEDFLVNYSEILSVFFEANAWAYIDMTCHTDNKSYRERHDMFVERIAPEVEKAANAVDEKIAASPAFNDLPAERYTQFKQKLQRELDLFREANVPLTAEVGMLSSQYEQLMGGLSAVIDGEELPIPRAHAKLQSPDRQEREKAWLAIWEARDAVKDKANQFYDDMRKLRQQMAENAGYQNFRDFQHDRLQRFDYTPRDAEAFSAAVEEFVVPLAREIDKRHRDRLGLAPDDYRPWDPIGEPAGQEPLKPFEKGTELLSGAKEIFSKLKPEFGENLQAMDDAGLFDLDSRKGKAPGGYNYGLEVTGMPFIFMNSAGTQRDLVTMMHEGGHAMHTFLTNSEPLVQYRDTPSEMAETASMSMELLTSHLWTRFYDDPADYKRARREHLEGIISFFPWCAVVDSF